MFVVAVDFDGTIFNGTKVLEETGVPNPKVVAKIRELLDNDLCEVVLWTCRTDQSLQEAIDNLRAINLELNAYNENAPSVQKQIDAGKLWHSRKILADLYVDDKSPGSIETFLRLDVERTARNFIREDATNAEKKPKKF